MAKRSSIRIKALPSVFSHDTDISFDANILRLLVLYEDLRIEIACFQVDTIRHADVANEGGYRKRYFLRQSIRTLLECAEAFRLLNNCSSIDYLLKHFNDAERSRWLKTVTFFADNEPLFRNVRNDLGGHFGVEPARFSIQSFTPKTIGKIEYSRDYAWKGAQYILHFTGEVTARAFLRHLPGIDSDEKYKHLLSRVRDGQTYSIDSMKDLISGYLWSRFG